VPKQLEILVKSVPEPLICSTLAAIAKLNFIEIV